MADRGHGYISSLRGCLGWGQDPAVREKNRDGFGFYGDRYQNTPFDGQLRPFVDPEHSDPTGNRRAPGGGIPPSRRGGPNERYLSEADGRYHYYEDEGFWDWQGDYHFLLEMGYFDNAGDFNMFNDMAERFGLGYFTEDREFYFYEDEIHRVDLRRLLQNIQGGRAGSTEYGEEQNGRAVADAIRDEEENARANRIRDDEENDSADNTGGEEETNLRDEYRDGGKNSGCVEIRDGGENTGCVENSDGDGQINLHEMEMETSDEGDEEVLQLPFIFPLISRLKKLDEAEEKEQFSTPSPSKNAGPLHSPAGYRSAPPDDQMHVVLNNLHSVSDRANSTAPKYSTDFRVRPSSTRSNGSSPTMASPDRPGPKHNTPEEKFHINKISGLVGSSRLAGRPTISSSLKRSGSSPNNSFGSLHALGASLPAARTGKPGTNRTSQSARVSSAGRRNPRLAHLPARYQALMTGDPFVDDVVAQEMTDWAREEAEEAKEKNRNKKGMAKPRRH